MQIPRMLGNVRWTRDDANLIECDIVQLESRNGSNYAWMVCKGRLYVVLISDVSDVTIDPPTIADIADRMRSA